MTKKQKRWLYALTNSDLDYEIKCICVMYLVKITQDGYRFNKSMFSRWLQRNRVTVRKYLRHAEQEGWLVRNRYKDLPHYYFLNIPDEYKSETELAEQHAKDEG